MSYNYGAGCGCGVNTCRGGCGFRGEGCRVDGFRGEGCGFAGRPNVVVEVAKFEDRSCAESTCGETVESECSKRDDCLVFTPAQTAYIHMAVSESVLQNNRSVDIINSKVNAMDLRATNAREDFARKLQCIEAQIQCIASFEVRLAEQDRFMRCELEKKERLLVQALEKIRSVEVKLLSNDKILEDNIQNLNNSLCGLKRSMDVQVNIDQKLLDMANEISLLKAANPSCQIDVTRGSNLPLGGPYGPPNPAADRPIYMQNGGGCGTNPANMYRPGVVGNGVGLNSGPWDNHLTRGYNPPGPVGGPGAGPGFGGYNPPGPAGGPGCSSGACGLR